MQLILPAGANSVPIVCQLRTNAFLSFGCTTANPSFSEVSVTRIEADFSSSEGSQLLPYCVTSEQPISLSKGGTVCCRLPRGRNLILEGEKGGELCAAPICPAHRSRDSDLSQPAVDINLYTRDVRRILRGQKRDGTCYFLGLSKPLHRNLSNDFLGEFIDGLLW